MRGAERKLLDATKQDSQNEEENSEYIENKPVVSEKQLEEPLRSEADNYDLQRDLGSLKMKRRARKVTTSCKKPSVPDFENLTRLESQ